MADETDVYSTYSALDFVFGLLISLAASVLNAFGLNLIKYDFARQERAAGPPRKDFQRPLWLVGTTLYILSQVVGSTLALEFLRAEYVAPLGATSLIFNVIFSYLLVGTAIERFDVIGTVVIIIGVVGVVVFGNHRLPTDFDRESNLSLSLLKSLWGRIDWIGYLTGMQVANWGLWWLARVMHEVCMERVMDDRSGNAEAEAGADAYGHGGRPELEDKSTIFKRMAAWWKASVRRHNFIRKVVKKWLETWSQSKSDLTIRKTAGFLWAVAGGLFAGQTLVFAKSAVKLVSSAVSDRDPNESNQFTSPLTWLIIVLLVVTAVTQITCLNSSLKCSDATFTVPIFFSAYTTTGFINSLVYLDEVNLYKVGILVAIGMSIVVLIVGVVLLSLKKPSTQQGKKKNPFADEDEEAGTSQQQVQEQEEPRRWGQGSLARLFEGGGFSFRNRGKSSPGEASRSARRNQPGMQRIPDGDDGASVAPSSTFEMGRMSERDKSEVGSVVARGDTKVFDAEEEDDDFGDFLEADDDPEEDRSTRRNSEDGASLKSR